MAMRETGRDERDRGNHISSDVKDSLDLVNSVREKLERLPPMSSNCCIYRAPRQLSQVAEKSFIPKMISIGPFHYGREDLQEMEKHKLRYLKEFLQQTGASLEDCIKLIKKSEARLRECYAEAIELDHNRFVEMILVDVAFLFVVLLRISFPELGFGDDYILGRPGMLRYIAQDMLLLENQLPFFIMEDLLTQAKVCFPPDNDARVILIKLSHKFFKRVIMRDLELHTEKLYSSKIEHLLDLLRSSLLPPELPIPKELKTLSIPNVTQLYHCGVKFKAIKHGNPSAVRFRKGILEIPRLLLCGTSELLARNLATYERYHFHDAYINDVAFVIDRLIDSPRDVEILIQHQMLETNLSDSQRVANLINNLDPGATMLCENFHFADLCEDLNAYCRVPWHKWKATLKREYFVTPWSIISVIAASVLLLLTFIQTLFTINSSRCFQMP